MKHRDVQRERERKKCRGTTFVSTLQMPLKQCNYEAAINSIELQKIVTLCDKILLKTLQLKDSSLLSLTCATLLTTWEAGSNIVYSP